MSSDELSDDTNGGADGEGVWAPHIEQSFQEALHMYPPCGRRKIIINDDNGKMYGRNELIARYIKVRTGKIRTRKQVSSHIQVLARRKIKENNTRVSSSTATPTTTTHLPTTLTNSSNNNHTNNTNNTNTNNISNINNNNNNNNNNIINTNNISNIVSVCNDSKSNLIDTVSSATSTTTLVNNINNSSSTPILINSTYDSSGIASQKLRLVEFFAFVKQCKTSQNDSGNSTYPHHPPHHHHQNGHHHHYYHHQPVSPLPSNHLMMMHHHHHQFIDNNDNTHFLIHINQRRQAIQYEKVDIAQIQDKFPEKGGLRDLYNQGPKDAFFLVKCWANLNENELDDQNSFYGFSSHFESNEEMTVFCETKVCSFGNVTAELAHRQKAVFAHGRYHYHSQQPLCEYMAEFLDKLRHLPEIALMNHVLENFTILKVITDEHTKETLLCIAFIFEVSEKHGATHNIYKLKGM